MLLPQLLLQGTDHLLRGALRQGEDRQDSVRAPGYPDHSPRHLHLLLLTRLVGFRKQVLGVDPVPQIVRIRVGMG